MWLGSHPHLTSCSLSHGLKLLKTWRTEMSIGAPFDDLAEMSLAVSTASHLKPSR